MPSTTSAIRGLFIQPLLRLDRRLALKLHLQDTISEENTRGLAAAVQAGQHERAPPSHLLLVVLPGSEAITVSEFECLQQLSLVPGKIVVRGQSNNVVTVNDHRDVALTVEEACRACTSTLETGLC